MSKKPATPSEHSEHTAFADWLRIVEKQTADFWWSSVGHGGMKLTPQMAGAMKRRGLKPGVPDVIGCYRGRFWAVEMKRLGPSAVSLEQELCHRSITLAGGAVFVAKGATAAIDFVKTMLGSK